MAKTKPRILFYFLHLLGVGHVHRAKRLIEGFAKAGMAVDVVYGGEPVAHIKCDSETTHFLPAIRASDASYTSYLDADGNKLERPFQDLRTSKLLEIYAKMAPDLILTEAFPFGRRMVRHELRALLDAAKARPKPPLIVSSVRDILHEGRKPGRNEETANWINNRYDHVLVHSDPEIIKLDATFALTEQIQHKVSYTGFVVPPSEPPAKSESYDIIVSAGGGAFGSDLLMVALETANSQPDKRWLIVCGPNLPTKTAEHLNKSAAPHITVVSTVTNLASHMKSARVSISQCGYNTAMDVLTAHRDSSCRAVFVPFDKDGQTEQLRRAMLLQDSGYAISLPQSQLTREKLANAIQRAARLPQVEHCADFDGVETSARLVHHWIEEKRKLN